MPKNALEILIKKTIDRYVGESKVEVLPHMYSFTDIVRALVKRDGITKKLAVQIDSEGLKDNRRTRMSFRRYLVSSLLIAYAKHEAELL